VPSKVVLMSFRHFDVESREMDTGDCRDYIDYIVSNDSYDVS